MDKGGEITMAAAGGISIPLDAVADILCCLPMKSVLRFKAVSKAWCSLIDSSYFARLQLSASNHDPMLVILTNEYIERTNYIVVCADFYSLDDDVDDAAAASSSLRQVRPRSRPFDPRRGYTYALGSCCNGILAFGIYGGNLDFWNPTTDQCYSTLLASDQTPAALDPLIRTPSVFYHDTCSNQYKLVQRVVQPDRRICEFQSYNLEANGFTTFHTLPGDHAVHPPHYSRGTPSCFVNGALHWLAAVSSDGFFAEIVALQLETLECYKLPLVRYRRYRYCKPTLVVFDGLLCATFSKDGFTRYKIDAWVMKEYGGKWTKLFNLTTSVDCVIYHKYVYPIAYSRNRDKVLLYFFFPDDFLGWYHLKREKLIPVKIPGAPRSFQAILCQPSLVNYQS
ncbi:hypothetical protein Tsubulata_038194 [Turnera subulata]|uniref:F-box domain-containing protein n=1 Tax=Turnera subulata TaxID=218843 RepID=A0A9Q0GIC8_9ROSI|nr:hypothetical protein Tsubulata_038194 [Turnera subulata]